MFKDSINSSSISKTLNIHALLFILLAVFSMRFLPATEIGFDITYMGPFFERYYNHNFLRNDLTTNVFAIPNPDFIYFYLIIALDYIFKTTWYESIMILKTFYYFCLPGMWYLGIYAIIKGRLDSEDKKAKAAIVIFIAVSILVLKHVHFFFSISGWPPFYIQGSPQMAATFLGLLGIITARFIKSKDRYFSIVIFFLATLVHPGYGLFFIFFYCLSMFERERIKELILTFLLGVIVPIGLLLLMFPSKSHLTTAEFIHYYRELGVVLFLPSEFCPFIPSVPWWVSFLSIIGLMIIAMIIGFKRKNNYLKYMSIVYVSTYAGSVLLQYLFFELYPIKLIIELGPIRLSSFGYWMLVILYTIILIEMFPLKLSIDTGLKRSYFVTFMLLSIILTIICAKVFKDNPNEQIRWENPEFYSWVEKNTSDDSVFVTYSGTGLEWGLRIITNRTIFIDYDPPHVEDIIPEYVKRLLLVRGSLIEIKKIKGITAIQRMRTFYRQLKPEDFVKISQSYKIDYVIVEAAFMNNFAGIKPVFRDKTKAVFDVRDLQKRDIETENLNKLL
jgi:hypothetical protein